ncbi:MAG TPA: hypothetical protein VK843_17390 [Planctomycetota bacterium]|nr:hypothetical protein [Planctomycetota bacterium]
MRTLIAAFLLALLPLAAAAVPGGKRCQVADSAVPTPGLSGLVMESRTDPAPAELRLSETQIDHLAELDTKLRLALEQIGARAARLPAGHGASGKAELAQQALPELVTRFLADACGDQALVIDIESAREFHLANAEALEARNQGDKTRWCPLCLGVRRGLEADFAWKTGELADLSPAQAKEAAELASQRDTLRRSWAAALKSELSPAQLTWLREAQMRWLKGTLQGSVAKGMRSLGAKKCEACATTVEWKCEFCSIVLGAVDEAKQKS